MKSKTSDRIFNGFNYLLLGIAAFFCLYPFLTILARAFSSDIANDTGQVTVYPIGFQLDIMKNLLSSSQYLKSFWVSVRVAVIGTVLGLVFTTLAAYPLSRRYFSGRKVLTILYVFTMLFNPGIIPNYILIRSLGMLNTLWALIIPGCISVYNMLIVKSYFESTPVSIEEAARIDGASGFDIFIRIMLPISLPILATISLFYLVGYWNAFFDAMMYITKTSLQPLQIYLRNLIQEALNPENMGNVEAGLSRANSVVGVRSATILATVLPIIMIYPFLQRYFIKGIMIGSEKG